MAVGTDNAPRTPAETLHVVRRLVLGLLAIGIVGTAADLLLTGHVEDAWQLAPLALFVASAVVIGWHLARGGCASLRAHQVVMGLFIVAGVVGTFLHYKANIEFEIEMYPELAGFALFWKAIQGSSPPSLAPGAMIALGLLGLVYAYRHPDLANSSPERLGVKS